MPCSIRGLTTISFLPPMTSFTFVNSLIMLVARHPSWRQKNMALISLFLAILVSRVSVCTTDSISQDYFVTSQSTNQTDVCATSKPNTTSVARNQIDCVRQCENSRQKCLCINYRANVTENCALFMYIPEAVQFAPGCRYFQRTNICEPPQYPIQAREEINCSFPFTVDGVLYSSCTMNVTRKPNICTTPGCFLANRTVAKCRPYTGFVAREVNYTVSSTITNQPNVTTISMFGWISIMRRKTGSGDGPWFMNWATYQNGFGFSSTYLWLGLERMYKLTTTGNWIIRFEYQYDSTTWLSAEYWTFTLGDNSQSYIIHVDGYSGDDSDRFRAGGSANVHNNNNRNFSTPDRDSTASDCASWFHRCWWNSECGLVHFTQPTPEVYLVSGVHKIINEVHVLMKAR